MQPPLMVEEAKTITISKLMETGHTEAVGEDFLHRTHLFTQCLGCIKREYAGIAAMKEIVGESTIEALVHVGGEKQFYLAMRQTLISRR